MQVQRFKDAREASDYGSKLGIEKSFFSSNLDIPKYEGEVMLFIKYSLSDPIACIILFRETREIGMWVHPLKRNAGVGTSFFQLVIIYCAEKLDISRLFAAIHYTDSNIYSMSMKQILEKCGFTMYFYTPKIILFFYLSEHI